jgi:hypothetical protein
MTHIHQEEAGGDPSASVCPSQENIIGKQSNGFNFMYLIEGYNMSWYHV